MYVGHGDAAEPGAAARLGHAVPGQRRGWGSSPNLVLQTRSAHSVVSLCAFPPELCCRGVVLPMVFSDFWQGEVHKGKNKPFRNRTMLYIEEEKGGARLDWELGNLGCERRGVSPGALDMSTGGRDCEAGGFLAGDSGEKLRISLEIPLISSGYTIEPGCQLNTRDGKAKSTCKSLRPNPRQCFFERRKRASLNRLIVQTG